MFLKIRQMFQKFPQNFACNFHKVSLKFNKSFHKNFCKLGTPEFTKQKFYEILSN